MGINHERNCCEVVLRILEEQHGALRADVRLDTAATRGIEAECRIADQHYALEHTLIEPFPENLKDDIVFKQVFDESIETDVKDSLRSDLAYDVYVDVYAFSQRSKAELVGIRKKIVVWLRASIPQLPEPTQPQRIAIRAEPPALPVSITLGCHRSEMNGGRMMPGRFAPLALESLRRVRLLKALRDKSPKLHAARRVGTRTVLILENRDIALTSEGGLSEAIDELASEITHMPDDIYVVGTYTSGHYYVTQVRRQGIACVNMGAKSGAWEFNLEDLSDS